MLLKTCFILACLHIAGSQVIAQNPAFNEKEVHFSNDTVQLAGTFIYPNQTARCPAIVFLHGSGPAKRSGARPYAEEFARLGIASLIFDKRGSGGSGGSWMTSSLNDLAHDAIAAIKLLKTFDNIDTTRIGLWGVSQAGWVASMTASQSTDIAFMTLISGGGVSPRESELYSYRSAMQTANIPEKEIADAERVINMYFGYLETGENRAGVVSELERSKEKPWYKYAQLDQILPSETNRMNWQWVAKYDPSSHIEKIMFPVLLMFGEKDTEFPTNIAVKKWREGLKKAGNSNATVMVFPGAGHGIRMREGYTGSGRPPFADGYAEAMIGWLWQHVVKSSK